jgi:ATP-dependent Lhr-like helicase
VLLITPESLESLFINRSSSIRRVMRHLQFVVIDELHAFVGSERGLHLRSLLFRLAQLVERDPRLVALSATLGEWSEAYARWLRPHRPGQVEFIFDAGQDRTIQLRIYGFTIGEAQPLGNSECTSVQDDEAGRVDIVGEMFRAFGGKKNLVFANRKDQVEWFADALNERCRRAGRSLEFMVHHGSVSKEVREHTETTMRSEMPCTTLCSSTLELGIDIGNVEEIGQIGPPWSVSSLVQRLGRSGRRDGTPSKMRLFVEDFPLSDQADLIDRLRPELLQSIALTELMLAKWIEPPTIDSFDFSTLTQQILSVLTETGGTSASNLYERLVAHGAFRYVDPSEFGRVLRSLGGHQLVEQMSEGDLILGIEGERIVKRFDFYSAFATEKEYAVMHAGQLIGTLPAIDPPPIGEHLLLGGRRWRVVNVDIGREEISVEPARGKKLPKFCGSLGEIHTVVRQRMREIALGDKPIGYLNRHAGEWLRHAREAAVEAGLPRTPWVPLSPQRCLLFTWTGTKTHRTLMLLAAAAKLTAADKGIAIEFNLDVRNTVGRLRAVLEQRPGAPELTQLVHFKQRRKYDRYLDDYLLAESFQRDALDVEEALAVIEGSIRNSTR